MMAWFKRFFEKRREGKTAKGSKLTADTVNVDPFSLAMKLVLGFEGGVSNHKNDKGGLTNFGVTQKTYDGFRAGRNLPTQSVVNISGDEVREIYRGYWLESGAHKLSLKAGIAVFDMAINSGSGRARRYWNLAKGDVDRFLTLREGFYRNLVEKDKTQKVFLNGWLNRLSHLREVLKGVKS